MGLGARRTSSVLSRTSLRGSAAGGARLRGRSPWRRPGSGSKRAVSSRIMCAPSRSDPRSGGAPPPALRRASHPGLLATSCITPQVDAMIDAGLAGKAAIVTGGSRGIGRAIVELLAGEGADVTFFFRDNADAARE